MLLKSKRKQSKRKDAPLMYKIADNLVECLYINMAELSNTGNNF